MSEQRLQFSGPLDHIIVELRPLARPMDPLIVDPENARKHDAANLKMIAESLIRFGQRSLLIVNKKTNFIAKGNGTYMAARMLGWTTIAYAYVEDDRVESLAYGLIDNETSDASTFDHQQKGKHLRELSEADYPLAQFWNPDEIAPYLHGEFKRPDISEEIFDPGMKKGRAITKVSAAERATIDRAVAFVRAKSKKSMQEGTALELICGEYIANHINEMDNEVTASIEVQETKIAALSLEDL